MIQHIVVLGGGSAGFLAAITLKVNFPGHRVTVLRSSELGIIGVGEGTTFGFPNYIHGRLGIDPHEFHRIAQPTWKLGIRFLNWGPRRHFDYTFRPQITSRWENLPKPNGYYCYEDFEYADVSPALMSHDKAFVRNQYGGPHIGTDLGYHIENQKFVSFLEDYAARLGIGILDDTVLEVRQDDAGVAGLVLKSGRTETADLYVDASGFASVLLSKTFGEPFVSFKPTLFCDRAVVGGWDRTDEPLKPYTTAEGMNAGWCWQIEHEHRVNRGYVFSTAFLSDDEAEREFRAKNPKVRSTRFVNFITGRYERAWVKNVVGIGNACGFVEPLEATSLAAICDECDSLVNSLAESDGRPTPSVVNHYNKRNAAKWDNIRRFLGIHYKFNTHFDTPFWRECRARADIGDAARAVEYFQENGPGTFHKQTILDPLDQFGLEGYWSLLIGQKAPCKRPYIPSQLERDAWRQIQQAFKAKAQAAVSIPEALALIRSPGFRWPPTLYTQQLFQVTI
jgi:tryptophan halogenase